MWNGYCLQGDDLNKLLRIQVESNEGDFAVDIRDHSVIVSIMIGSGVTGGAEGGTECSPRDFPPGNFWQLIGKN